MENHYHIILRTRPDIVASWSGREVATRWLTLCPKRRKQKKTPPPTLEEEICALTDWPERIAQLRLRLCSLSWFMGQLNEFIARAANKEDDVKGRFWESRFKCQALLDEAAIAVCMTYVDLNPIRAGLANTPEESDFTSIQERIRAWQKETITTALVAKQASQNTQSTSFEGETRMPDEADELSNPILASASSIKIPFDEAVLPISWLCPIQSDSQRRGILQMTAVDYFNLVDKSARMTRSDKRGAMDADLAQILLRIGANAEVWLDTIAHFGSQFHLAAGLLYNLRNFADRLGSRWLKGVTMARLAFAS